MLDLGQAVLRPFEEGDAPSLALHADDPHVAANLRDRFPQPYTEKDAREWIGRVRDESPARHFAIVVAGAAVGSIGIRLPSAACPVGELGYWLGRPFQGRGIGSLAVQRFSDHAFATLGLTLVYAMVFDGNHASARVLEKAGFACRGRLRLSVIKGGRLLDQLLYARAAPRRA